MRRRIYLLLGHDPGAGVAARVAGVLGVEGERMHVSFVPYEPSAAAWRDRIFSAAAPMAEALRFWEEIADGISFDIAEVPAPEAADLSSAVESLLDGVLATPAAWPEGEESEV